MKKKYNNNNNEKNFNEMWKGISKGSVIMDILSSSSIITNLS